MEIPVKELIAIAHAQVLKAAKRRAMAFLVGKIKFFSFPIVNPIVGFIVEQVILWLIDEGDKRTFFVYIDVKVFLQDKRFVRAAQRNWDAQRGGSKHEIVESENALIYAARKLIKFNL